jgi:hypothetical protein
MKAVRIITLMALVLTISANVSADPTSWGLGAGVHDGDFGAQIRKDFWLGGDISQITAQGSVFFHGKTTFKIDADYHFMIGEGKSRFYPLAGLQFAFTSSNAEFGINAGGGLNFMLTEKMAAFAEAKFVFGDWDGLTIIGGIYF